MWKTRGDAYDARVFSFHVIICVPIVCTRAYVRENKTEY